MSRRVPSWDVGLIALAGVVVVAVWVMLLVISPGPVASVNGTSSSQPSLEPEETAVVSALSDSHIFNADSWFRQTVEAGRVEGAEVGTFASYPGGTTSTVRQGLTRLGGSDVVVVSAGTNDLLSARSPEETARSVEALVADAGKRVDVVLLSTVPPSDTRGAETKALNGLLTAWARRHHVAVLDVTSPVSDPDGTWRQGLSDDGIHANDRGAALMTRAAMRQLPSLID